jgi:OPT oligopeptide transporter protein
MQCMGYALAGLARSCLVFRDFAIYPLQLPTIVLNRGLHEKRSGMDFTVWRFVFNRYRWLWTWTGLYFVWHM